MTIYWFFDLKSVAEQNKFLKELRNTETFLDAYKAFTVSAGRLKRRSGTDIPFQ
jgi:hypothetical protein